MFTAGRGADKVTKFIRKAKQLFQKEDEAVLLALVNRFRELYIQEQVEDIVLIADKATAFTHLVQAILIPKPDSTVNLYFLQSLLLAILPPGFARPAAGVEVCERLGACFPGGGVRARGRTVYGLALAPQPSARHLGAALAVFSKYYPGYAAGSAFSRVRMRWLPSVAAIGRSVPIFVATPPRENWRRFLLFLAVTLAATGGHRGLLAAKYAEKALLPAASARTAPRAKRAEYLRSIERLLIAQRPGALLSLDLLALVVLGATPVCFLPRSLRAFRRELAACLPADARQAIRGGYIADAALLIPRGADHPDFRTALELLAPRCPHFAAHDLSVSPHLVPVLRAGRPYLRAVSSPPAPVPAPVPAASRASIPEPVPTRTPEMQSVDTQTPAVEEARPVAIADISATGGSLPNTPPSSALSWVSPSPPASSEPSATSVAAGSAYSDEPHISIREEPSTPTTPYSTASFSESSQPSAFSPLGSSDSELSELPPGLSVTDVNTRRSETLRLASPVRDAARGRRDFEANPFGRSNKFRKSARVILEPITSAGGEESAPLLTPEHVLPPRTPVIAPPFREQFRPCPPALLGYDFLASCSVRGALQEELIDRFGRYSASRLAHAFGDSAALLLAVVRSANELGVTLCAAKSSYVLTFSRLLFPERRFLDKMTVRCKLVHGTPVLVVSRLMYFPQLDQFTGGLRLDALSDRDAELVRATNAGFVLPFPPLILDGSLVVRLPADAATTGVSVRADAVLSISVPLRSP